MYSSQNWLSWYIDVASKNMLNKLYQHMHTLKILFSICVQWISEIL
jgi:hypothetical protein